MADSLQNIAVVGDIGTGSTTLAKRLAERLDWHYLSAGDIFRKWHQDNNIPLEDTLHVPPDLDKEIDFSMQDRMKHSKHQVFDSRLGGWLAKGLPPVLKILCVADFAERVKRVASREAISKSQAEQIINKRSADLAKKFLDLYGVKDALDPQLFDLVIDTTKLDAEDVFTEVYAKLLSRFNKL